MKEESQITRRRTREVHVGDLIIGGDAPVSVQSMCATKTQNIQQTLDQIRLLQDYGAGIIRIAADNKKDVEALAEIRKQTNARLAVDLQEAYRLAGLVAPYVQKIRYNPGHLFHHEQSIPVREKVAYLVNVAKEHGLAIRIGINAGSLDPALRTEKRRDISSALASAREHVSFMLDLGFEEFVVSLKSADPNEVVEMNKSFAEEFPEVPLHLGVTEAGMLPAGEEKTRAAFENLLRQGIGETLRVSLTLPNHEKFKEVLIGRQILEDVQNNRFKAVLPYEQRGLNIVACPSCSRVENQAFIQLAEKVRDMAAFASSEDITIAVMGCRVNGPGESDDADIGLWCAPKHVNLKRKGAVIGAFSYEEILEKVKEELLGLIEERNK